LCLGLGERGPVLDLGSVQPTKSFQESKTDRQQSTDFDADGSLQFQLVLQQLFSFPSQIGWLRCYLPPITRRQTRAFVLVFKRDAGLAAWGLPSRYLVFLLAASCTSDAIFFKSKISRFTDRSLQPTPSNSVLKSKSARTKTPKRNPLNNGVLWKALEGLPDVQEPKDQGRLIC